MSRTGGGRPTRIREEVGLEHEEIDQEVEQVIAHLGVVDEHLAVEGGGETSGIGVNGWNFPSSRVLRTARSPWWPWSDSYSARKAPSQRARKKRGGSRGPGPAQLVVGAELVHQPDVSAADGGRSGRGVRGRRRGASSGGRRRNWRNSLGSRSIGQGRPRAAGRPHRVGRRPHGVVVGVHVEAAKRIDSPFQEARGRVAASSGPLGASSMAASARRKWPASPPGVPTMPRSSRPSMHERWACSTSAASLIQRTDRADRRGAPRPARSKVCALASAYAGGSIGRRTSQRSRIAGSRVVLNPRLRHCAIPPASAAT